MRGAAMLRETARNLLSGTSRLHVFGVFAVFGAALLVVVEVLTVSAIVADAEEYRDSGASIVTLELPGLIDGRACEALSTVPDVRAAGAMRETEAAIATALPGEPLRAYITTPSFAAVVGATDAGEGVYLPRDAAASLGRRSVSVNGATISVRGVYAYPQDGRRAGFGWAVLSPTREDDGLFDECWALIWPQRDDARRLMLTTLSADIVHSSGDPQITQLNAGRGAVFTGSERFNTRVTQFAPHAAWLFAAALACSAVWIRRVEIASNLGVGAPRMTLFLQHLLEVLAWSLPSAVTAGIIGLCLSATTAQTELASLSASGVAIAGAFFSGSMVGAGIGFHVIRPHRLARYAKER